MPCDILQRGTLTYFPRKRQNNPDAQPEKRCRDEEEERRAGEKEGVEKMEGSGQREGGKEGRKIDGDAGEAQRREERRERKMEQRKDDARSENEEKRKRCMTD